MPVCVKLYRTKNIFWRSLIPHFFGPSLYPASYFCLHRSVYHTCTEYVLNQDLQRPRLHGEGIIAVVDNSVDVNPAR